MTITRRFISHACNIIVALAVFMSLSPLAYAVEPLSSGGKDLLAKYPAVKDRLEKNKGMHLQQGVRRMARCIRSLKNTKY